MMGKRNVYSFLARQRKAGPHSEAKRPERDVFDHINEYADEQCEELKARKVAQPFPFVGDRVRVVDGGPYHFEVGRVTVRKDGKFGVVFDWDMAGVATYYEPMHLEIV